MSIDLDLDSYASVRHQEENQVGILTIERPNCRARVSLLGGQVLSFTPHGQPPLLWENSRLEIRQGTAQRQGIPICWPWFGPLENNDARVSDWIRGQLQSPDQMPAHGLVRDRLWELVSTSEDQDATELVMACKEPLLNLAISAHYRFSDRLSCRLTSYNHTALPISLSFALHTYFAVSDIADVSIHDLDGVPFLDSLERGAKHVQNEHLRIDRETDRIYYNTPSLIRIKDAGWHRTITLDCPQSQSAIVWNPWTEKSKRLSQFAPESYRKMLCVETARAANNFLSLDPGQSESIELVIQSLAS